MIKEALYLARAGLVVNEVSVLARKAMAPDKDPPRLTVLQDVHPASRVDTLTMAESLYGGRGLQDRLDQGWGLDRHWHQTIQDTLDLYTGHAGGLKRFTMRYAGLCPFMYSDEAFEMDAVFLENYQVAITEDERSRWRTQRKALRRTMADHQLLQVRQQEVNGRMIGCVQFSIQHGAIESEGTLIQFPGQYRDISLEIPDVDVFSQLRETTGRFSLRDLFRDARKRHWYKMGMPFHVRVFVNNPNL